MNLSTDRVLPARRPDRRFLIDSIVFDGQDVFPFQSSNSAPKVVSSNEKCSAKTKRIGFDLWPCQ